MISIIIPTLNEEKKIQSCLNSLVNQTLNDFEVLIVDGGSHDTTLNIVREFGPRIIEVPKKRAHDVSCARNEGIKVSKGDILVFLDADTLLSTNCLEVLDDCFRSPRVVGVSCQTLPLDGNHLENLLYRCNNLLIDLSNRMRMNQFSYFSCLGYKRDSVTQVGGFREDLHACEDIDLARRLSRLGKFVFTKKARCLTSPRRLRQWSYPRYLAKYVKYLSQYYILGHVYDDYEDLH